MSTDIKDKLKTNSQKRENIKLNLILIIYLTLIQSRLCHCCLKYPTPTRHCQKWKITNYSLLINKNGTSAQAFILLLFSIVSTKRSVGEFTNSLLHSWPCCATWEPAAVWGRNFTSLHPEEPTFSHSPKGRFVSLTVTSKIFFMSLNRLEMVCNEF